MWFKSRFTITTVAALCFCFFGGTTPAYADFGDQLAKLLADDGVVGDEFGFSVAISGTTAIVGANRDDDNGSQSGSAYLFEVAGTADPCPWDLDGSGSVGTGDLLELFAQWGTAGSADFDESGVVDTSDLLILFANWGPCP